MAITKQDVFRVANEIDAEGCKPSAVEVRRRLGTGSYTTITASLREWVKPEADEAEGLEPMPGEFEERLMQAGADLFALAMKVAGEQFQDERDAWEAERQQLRSEINQGLALADQIAEELDAERKARAEAYQAMGSANEERAAAMALRNEYALTAQEARQEAEEAQGKVATLIGRAEALEAIIAQLKPPAPAEKPAGANGDAGRPGQAESVAKKRKRNPGFLKTSAVKDLIIGDAGAPARAGSVTKAEV